MTDHKQKINAESIAAFWAGMPSYMRPRQPKNEQEAVDIDRYYAYILQLMKENGI